MDLFQVNSFCGTLDVSGLSLLLETLCSFSSLLMPCQHQVLLWGLCFSKTPSSHTMPIFPNRVGWGACTGAQFHTLHTFSLHPFPACFRALLSSTLPPSLVTSSSLMGSMMNSKEVVPALKELTFHLVSKTQMTGEY